MRQHQIRPRKLRSPALWVPIFFITAWVLLGLDQHRQPSTDIPIHQQGQPQQQARPSKANSSVLVERGADWSVVLRVLPRVTIPSGSGHRSDLVLNSTGIVRLAVDEQEQFCASLPPGQPPNVLNVSLARPESSGNTASNSTQALLLQNQRSFMYSFDADGNLSGTPSENYSMYAYSSSPDIVSNSLLYLGSWELPLTQQLLYKLSDFAQARGLPPSSVVMVDIGANLGAHSLAVAAFGFSVLAFEPMHINLALLRRSLCANPRLRQRMALVPKGLGNATQQCRIYSLPTNIGDGTVVCSGDGSPVTGPPDMVLREPALDITRLDDLLDAATLKRLAGRVGVVKIDVEGHELSVLEGGLKFFEAVRPPNVLAEVSDPMMLAATGRPVAAFLQKMSGLGYAAHARSVFEPALPVEQLENVTEFLQDYWFTLAR